MMCQRIGRSPDLDHRLRLVDGLFGQSAAVPAGQDHGSHRAPCGHDRDSVASQPRTTVLWHAPRSLRRVKRMVPSHHGFGDGPEDPAVSVVVRSHRQRSTSGGIATSTAYNAEPFRRNHSYWGNSPRGSLRRGAGVLRSWAKYIVAGTLIAAIVALLPLDRSCRSPFRPRPDPRRTDPADVEPGREPVRCRADCRQDLHRGGGFATNVLTGRRRAGLAHAGDLPRRRRPSRSA